MKSLTRQVFESYPYPGSSSLCDCCGAHREEQISITGTPLGIAVAVNDLPTPWAGEFTEDGSLVDTVQLGPDLFLNMAFKVVPYK